MSRTSAYTSRQPFRLGGLGGGGVFVVVVVVVTLGLLATGCPQMQSEADYDALREDPLPEARAYELTHTTLRETLASLRTYRDEAEDEAANIRAELAPRLAEMASFEELHPHGDNGNNDDNQADAKTRDQLALHAQYTARIEAAETFIKQAEYLLPRWDEATIELNNRQSRHDLYPADFASNTAAGKVHAETQALLNEIETWRPREPDEDTLRKTFEQLAQESG